jgi:hypothetical protein
LQRSSARWRHSACCTRARSTRARCAVVDPQLYAGAVAGTVALLWAGHMYEIGFGGHGAAKPLRRYFPRTEIPPAAVTGPAADRPFHCPRTRVAPASRLRRTL